jgi:WXG100 family type VII secretion target
MSTQQLRAGHGTLAHAAALVAEARSDLDQQAAGLQSRVLAAQGRWQGAGGSAFFAVQQAWTQKQTVILSALDDFEAALRGTQTRNEAADEAAMALQNAHLHRLDGVRR